MSLEQEGNKHKKKNLGLSDSIRGAALSAAILGTSIITTVAEARREINEINKHVLSPSMIAMLKSKTGAEDADINALEDRIRLAVLEQLKEILQDR
jgi:hypothetical protein